MTVCTADFEAGTNGATIGTGDPGSATAWDIVSIAAGNITYSNVQAAAGTQSAFFSNTAGEHCFGWSTAIGTLTEHYGRLYLYVAGNPGSSFLAVTQGYSVGATGWQILVNTAGKLVIGDSASTLTTFTNAIATGQWIRIEWHVVHSTTVGQVEIKLFNTATSTIATETFTSTANKNTLANQDTQRFGYPSGGLADIEFYLDQIVAGDTSYPGPFVAPTVAAAVMVPRHAVGAGRW